MRPARSVLWAGGSLAWNPMGTGVEHRRRLRYRSGDHRRRLTRAVPLGAVALILMAECWSASAGAVTSPASSSWTAYHGNAAGAGVTTSVASVDTTRPAWTSPVLDGHLYGEPLVFGSDVYVASEDDTVYALSSSTGAVVWSAHVGTPVPSSALPCGNITPEVGITGTPVIDPARSEIFVVADVLVDGNPAHMLFGLSTDTGHVELDQDVDPPGANPGALLQRTGLTLDAGKVVFGMGGNYGDCATYRGRVIGVDEAGGTPSTFTVDSAGGEDQGAVWMGGGAPAVDSAGDIWVEAGNGSVYSPSHAYDDSDSVLELSSGLTLLQYFAPTDWPENNQQDLDMSTEPALLASGQVVGAGKSGMAYLLDGSHVGGIGGEEASLATGCGNDVDGGTAVVGMTVFLPCVSGIIAVRASSSPPGLRDLWNSGKGGGPPIVAAGLVWTIGQNGTLYGLNPATGTVEQQTSLGAPANHFPTPSVGDGLFLVPESDRVAALTTMATGTPVATTTSTLGAAATTTTVAVPGTHTAAGSGSGGPPAGAIAAIVVGGGAVLGLIGWLLRRRRRGHG